MIRAFLRYPVVACGLLAAPLMAQVPFWDQFQATAGPRAADRAAQVRAESGFNPRAANSIGAKGLGQFMPATWQAWAPGQDPFDPGSSINAQHRYMNWLEGRTGGDWIAALGSYNAGLGSVRKAQRLASDLGLAGSRAWLRALPGVTHDHAIETQTYVQRIETIHLPWVKKKAGQ